MIKATVNNNTMESNKRQCTCKKCGMRIYIGEGIKVYSGNTFGYMHSICAKAEEGGYSTENSIFKNHQTKTNNNTISIEMEVGYLALHYNEEASFGWLKEVGFIATPDGSVWREFKSPIYNNLLGLSKILSNFEKLHHLEKWNSDDDYGTHCNIGNLELTPEKMNIIRRFYNSLFVTYCEYLKANKQKTIALYGRDFTYYARTINEYSQAGGEGFGGCTCSDIAHCNFINMQHNTHIEFRLCKLVSARQYMLCTRLNCDIVQKCIVDYFLKRYDESMTAQQKQTLAKKASQKMCKLFDRYYEKLINE